MEAQRLFESIPWRGDELVLDVGCGRGLLLVEAAKRLSRGRAVGVDIWSAKDLWGNSREAALENAEILGVRDRVEVRSADARRLPFEDASIDVVVSSIVIHNLKGKRAKQNALEEMVRVLRPGGRMAIIDIMGTWAYRNALVRAGMEDVRRTLTQPLFIPGAARVTALKPRQQQPASTTDRRA
jgi:ubiquinone/menaquinone biosynthesis C-methylase UbiE